MMSNCQLSTKIPGPRPADLSLDAEDLFPQRTERSDEEIQRSHHFADHWTVSRHNPGRTE